MKTNFDLLNGNVSKTVWANPDHLPPMEFMTYDRSKNYSLSEANYSLSEANVLLRSLNLRIDREWDRLWVAKQCKAEDDFTRQILDSIKRLEKERSDLRTYTAGIESIAIAETQTGLSGVQAADTPKPDRVNHPSHYTSHPSGVECITITEHYDFCVGNAIKYLWRCGLKVEEGMTPKDKEIEDLKKAVYYINRKIKNLEK